MDKAREGIAVARPLWTVTILFAADTISLLIAALLATVVAEPIASVNDLSTFHPAYMILIAPLAYTISGLYPATAVGAIDEFRRLTRSTVGVGVAAVVALMLMTNLAPPWQLLLATACATVTVPIGRALAREAFARRHWWGVQVVILGAGETARLVIERLRLHPRTGVKPLVCLDDDPAKIGTEVAGVPVAGAISASKSYVDRGVRIAIVAMPGVSPRDLMPLVGRHATNFRSVVLVPNLFGMKTLGVETCDLGDVLGLAVHHNLNDPLNRALKRSLDLAVLIPSILVALPLLGLAALGIMLVSPGSPFYYQVRTGQGGRPIRVWKMRTMYLDATERLEELLERDPAAKRQWTRNFKLARDPRILPVVGTFLRRSSWDELPQMLNVLRGEMSLVGPRPFPEYHLDVFSDDFRELRTTVPPGITGLWQVSGRSDGDVTVQRDVDTYYIRNWSVWMDLYVLARTPLVVLSARGAR